MQRLPRRVALGDMDKLKKDKPSQPNLAPWVHPKSKKWFQELFDQSGLVMRLRDVLDNVEQPIGPEEARVLIMVVSVLGHEGVWPSDQKKELQRIALRLGKLAKSGSTESGTPISVEEHQRRKVVEQEVQQELEMLRRIVGISNRVSDLHMPKSWGQFWT